MSWETDDQRRVRMENHLIRSRADYIVASNSLALARRIRRHERFWERRVLERLSQLWFAQKATESIL